MMSKIFFFFYWFFDNLSILSVVKLLKRNPEKDQIIASAFWFMGLTSYVTIYLIETFSTKKYNKVQKSRELSPSKFAIKIKSEKTDSLLNVIKYSFDLLPAGKDSLIWEKLFKIRLPEELAGLGGLSSAIIASYQAYISWFLFL